MTSAFKLVSENTLSSKLKLLLQQLQLKHTSQFLTAQSTTVPLIIFKAHLILVQLLLVINSHSLVSLVSRSLVRVKLLLFLKTFQELLTTVTTTSSITTVENQSELTNLSTLVLQEDNPTLHSKDLVKLLQKLKVSALKSLMVLLTMHGNHSSQQQLILPSLLFLLQTSLYQLVFSLLTLTSTAGFNNLAAEMLTKKPPFREVFLFSSPIYYKLFIIPIIIWINLIPSFFHNIKV